MCGRTFLRDSLPPSRVGTRELSGRAGAGSATGGAGSGIHSQVTGEEHGAERRDCDERGEDRAEQERPESCGADGAQVGREADAGERRRDEEHADIGER